MHQSSNGISDLFSLQVVSRGLGAYLVHVIRTHQPLCLQTNFLAPGTRLSAVLAVLRAASCLDAEECTSLHLRIDCHIMTSLATSLWRRHAVPSLAELVCNHMHPSAYSSEQSQSSSTNVTVPKGCSAGGRDNIILQSHGPCSVSGAGRALKVWRRPARYEKINKRVTKATASSAEGPWRVRSGSQPTSL